MEAVRIRKAGFPIRVPIDTFVKRFAIMMGKKSSAVSAATDRAAAAQQIVSDTVKENQNAYTLVYA